MIRGTCQIQTHVLRCRMLSLQRASRNGAGPALGYGRPVQARAWSPGDQSNQRRTGMRVTPKNFISRKYRFVTNDQSVQGLGLLRKFSAVADGGAGGGGGSGDGGKGLGGGGGDGDDPDDDEEFLNLQQAEELAAAKGVELPADYAAVAASAGGIRAGILTQYCALATTGFFTSMLTRSIPAFRDRLIADKLYFYKLLVEIVIDSGCATVAEVRKRGEDFWNEFEFYLSDMLVGLVMDVVLVSLLAPVAVPGKTRVLPSGKFRQWSSQLPSAVFERSIDRKYTISDRASCFFVRGFEYALAGFACGLVGQGIASSLMSLKRKHFASSENDVEPPPVFESALVWAGFMGVSANTRYQIVFGLERIVDDTIARRIPQIAYLTTMAIRFANNIIGGEQFIDMARWAGVQ